MIAGDPEWCHEWGTFIQIRYTWAVIGRSTLHVIKGYRFTPVKQLIHMRFLTQNISPIITSTNEIQMMWYQAHC